MMNLEVVMILKIDGVEFDDDCFSDDPTSFSNEERDHSQERSGVHNYDGCSDEPPVKEYWRRRAFGTDNPQTDKITDKPDEELPKYRRACYQC